MTRFARAKGSKAANEKLPEQATSWSEMKQELLNKNKELEENKNREKALKQRQANYQTFLDEKEKEEEKNISWADFPEIQDIQQKSSMKRKDDSDGVGNSKKFLKVNGNLKKSTEVNGNDSDDSDEQFKCLKSQIDKVLAEQKSEYSDSDAPPEEASFKDKPQEIIVKKAKISNRKKLQILINPKGKSTFKEGLEGKEKKNKNIKEDVMTNKNQNLTEKDRKKIEKKKERSKKQLEKKIEKRKEKQISKLEPNMNEEKANNTQNKSIDSKDNSKDVIEAEAKRLKKLERRKKQKEKKLKLKEKAGLVKSLDEKSDEVLTEKDLIKIQKKKERRARQADKRKKIREAKEKAAKIDADNQSEHNEIHEEDNIRNNNNKDINKKFENKFSEKRTGETQNSEENKQAQKPKEKKVRHKDRNTQRNKSKPETMFINGKSIEIDYVDGFPVKKEDADRLRKLRKEMISKGLPRSEINIALKLERRRAEKALSRENKNVCFNCRKSGHNLSECPELGKDQIAQTSGTGICFKCGSTEHTHFECKVVKGEEFKFATCFICKEQGHISRQCPDNQRGLYPKGGACKVCGDVTHLKKDCPKYQAQQAQLQASLSVDTISNENPDDLGSNSESKMFAGPVKKLNKIRF